MTVLEDCRVYAGALDLSGQSNKIELAAELAELDVTTFDSGGWKEVTGGLSSASMKAEGLQAFSTVDATLWASMGTSEVWTVSPAAATVGALAYFTNIVKGKYSPLSGSVGDAAPWSAEGSSTWPLIRGVHMHPSGTPRTADGDGTAVQVGAVGANQRLYASLHVLSVAGTTPTIDVTVESDSVETFDATPETRLTFTQAAAAGGQLIRTAAGVHADTWYRVSWDVSASGGESFLFVVALGIG